MVKLLKHLKEYTKESIIGPLFKLLEASFELVIPLVMASIIDVGIKNRDYPYIYKMAALMIFLGLLGLACSLTAQYFAAKAAAGFGTDLRKHLFSHINKLSFQAVDQAGTSTLITRMTNDINQVQSGVNLVLRLFLRSPFIVAGAAVMAYTIHMRISLFFLFAILILSLVIYGIIAITIPLYKKVQSRLDRVLLSARENLSGARVIRALNRQEDEINQFQESSDGLMKVQLLTGKISALLYPSTFMLVNAAIIAVIWFGGIEVKLGVLTQGEVVALINYMSQILLALLALANLIIAFTRAWASGARIQEVFEMPSRAQESQEKDEPLPAVEADDMPVIEFRDVSFAYATAQENTLSNISFTIKRGETIGIIGGTGSGKTTLIHLIPRFYDATKGTVLVNGQDVQRCPLKQLRNIFGFVQQHGFLFRGTVRENMKMGKKDATDNEILKALEVSQARDFVDKMPEGLDTLIEQGGKNLSGGQKQRLTIARAVVRQPDILVLDDSSSALDYATDARLQKALRDRLAGITVLLVTQRVANIRNADRIMVLEDGQVVGFDTHSRLMATCEVYREICTSQGADKEGTGV